MAEKSHLFDDLAGVAGGAFSVLVGMRDETEAALKDRFDELKRRFDLASRPDLEAVKELAANARTATEDAAQSLEAVGRRLEAIEQRLGALEQRVQGESGQASQPSD